MQCKRILEIKIYINKNLFISWFSKKLQKSINGKSVPENLAMYFWDHIVGIGRSLSLVGSKLELSTIGERLFLTYFPIYTTIILEIISSNTPHLFPHGSFIYIFCNKQWKFPFFVMTVLFHLIPLILYCIIYGTCSALMDREKLALRSLFGWLGIDACASPVFSSDARGGWKIYIFQTCSKARLRRTLRDSRRPDKLASQPNQTTPTTATYWRHFRYFLIFTRTRYQFGSGIPGVHASFPQETFSQRQLLSLAEVLHVRRTFLRVESDHCLPMEIERIR